MKADNELESIDKYRELKWEPQHWVVIAHVLILALGKQTQVEFCDFEASLVYAVSSRTARTAIQRKPVLKKNQNNKTNV